MRTRTGRVVVCLAALAFPLLAFADPASAAVTESNGNTLPLSGDAAGRCGAGQRWVFVSKAAETSYNPLAKTTDSLGASSTAPPNANADQFNDGVTITILTGGINASFTVNEAVDPTTTIAINKVVVKAGNHYTTYTGSDAAPSTPRSSPHTGATMGVSHAFVCYSLGPPAVVPETGVTVLLPLSAVMLGGAGWLMLRRQRRAGPVAAG